MVKVEYINQSDSTECEYSYEYDSNGNLCRFTDGGTGTTTIYKYNNSGKLIKMIEYDTEDMKNNFGVSYDYDAESRLSYLFYHQDYLYNSTEYANYNGFYNYVYNADNTLRFINVYMNYSQRYSASYTYDDFGRYASKVISLGSVKNTTSYSYCEDIELASPFVSQYTSSLATANPS